MPLHRPSSRCGWNALRPHCRLLFGPVLLMAAIGCALRSGHASAADSIPSFDAITRVVESRLASQRDYKPGDIISRDQVQQILDHLARLGWPVPQREKLLDETLPPGDFLVQRLRTEAGRILMRRIARDPLGYDRLDRLSRMAQGPPTIDMLIASPGGYQLIDYLTSTPEGLETGRLLSQAPGGTDFNKPTGRIYTADDLLRKLRKRYQQTLRSADES
jgi:hypothetical protein